jgi:hypothetical protein
MDSPTDLVQLVYVSTADAPFTPAQLHDLLSVARANNARVGVTGMLLYHDGNFIQALEGPRAAVAALQERIALDPRHHGMLLLYHTRIETRSFAEWSMGFVDPTRSGAVTPEGFSSFLVDGDLTKALVREPRAARRLLETFRSSVRR